LPLLAIFTRNRSALGLHDLAFAVVTARTANVMRAALFAAIRAFIVAGRRQLVMRPAHVAA
jgi:phage major head subunit gpT-like protein